MKIRRISVMVFIGLYVFSGLAFATEQWYFTKDPRPIKVFYENGRYWMTMSKIAKVAYLKGIQDGMLLIVTQIEDKDKRKKLASEYLCGLSMSEISDLIDKLYNDTYNIRIPIMSAYYLVVFKATGGSHKEFEEKVSGLREIWK